MSPNVQGLALLLLGSVALALEPACAGARSVRGPVDGGHDRAPLNFSPVDADADGDPRDGDPRGGDGRTTDFADRHVGPPDAGARDLAPLDHEAPADTKPPGDTAPPLDTDPPPDTSPNGQVGCSDGHRDGFTNQALFPAIAGCKAAWKQSSMLAPRSGVACGNSLSVVCNVPADACAPGWHVCGGPDGPADINQKISQAQCAAEAGEYVAALGDLNCGCATGGGFGAVCCGDGCVQQHGDCVWAGQTAWMGVIEDHINSCGDSVNNYPDFIGVLCCRD